MKPEERRRLIIRLCLLLALLVLTVFLIINRQKIQQFTQYGYAGIFLLSILANATIIFPLPGVVFTSAMGAVFNPLWVAVAAGCGAALGEMTGYLAGFSGQFIVEDRDWYEKVTRWMNKYGSLTVLVMSFIPNPLFDLAGIAAGVLKMSVPRFLFWCLIGKTLKMLVFAYTGSTVLQLLGI
jgi:membrane protein YqaA with SNARE-associated domain